MIEIHISGVYSADATVSVDNDAGERHYDGVCLLLQQKAWVIGRAHLAPRGTSVEEEVESERLSFDLSFVIANRGDPSQFNFEGQITSQGKRYTGIPELTRHIDIKGSILPTKNSLAFTLGPQGAITLRQEFTLGNILDDPSWTDFYRQLVGRTRPWSLTISHEQLEIPLKRYFKRSSFETNVFVMMRFSSTPENLRIRRTIEDALGAHDLMPQFADNLTVAEGLWDNVSTYMIGSRFGIAVIEEIEERSFNPNVAIEIGYMRALQRRVLVLKDKRVPELPADLIGNIYREFDSYNLEETIWDQIDRWARELRSLGELQEKFYKMTPLIAGDDEDVVFK